MSYDLMVFEPDAAPKGHELFLTWYSEQMEWKEGCDYGDLSVASARLQAFFADINVEFPTLHGVFAEEELPKSIEFAAEYIIAPDFIYVCFSWSKVEAAFGLTFNLAEKHKLGFLNVSSDDSEVWLPGQNGLVLADQDRKPSLWSKLFKRNRQ